MYQQKLNYIHNNPVKAGLCELPEEYKYSSAKFYELNINDWNFYQTQVDNGLLVTHATAQTYAMLNTNNGKVLGNLLVKTPTMAKEFLSNASG